MKKPMIIYEKTIDLKFLLREILKKWYLLVIFSLVLAILAGTVEFLNYDSSGISSVGNSDEAAYYWGEYLKCEEENAQLEKEYKLVSARLRKLNNLLGVNRMIIEQAEKEELTTANVIKWLKATETIVQLSDSISEIGERNTGLKNSISINEDRMAYYKEMLGKDNGDQLPISSIIMKGVLGAVLGVLIVCVGVLLKCFFNYKLQYERELTDQFGIPLLGNTQNKTWDYSIAAAKLQVLADEKERILFCGTVDRDRMEKICEKFRDAAPDDKEQRFAVGGCLTEDPESISKIKDGAIVMVESIGETKMKEFSNIISFLGETNSKVIGVIIC